jgi:hypothetical protein
MLKTAQGKKLVCQGTDIAVVLRDAVIEMRYIERR